MKTLLSFTRFAFIAAFILFSKISVGQSFENISFRTAALVQDIRPYVQLNWSATKEKISYFIIERSVDGKNFKQAAMVFASDDPQFADYKFRDKNLASATGSIYYRIGLVNESNELVYLPVRRILLEGGNAGLTVSTSPNPLRQQLKVNLPAAWQNRAVEVGIYTPAGMMVQSAKIARSHGSEILAVESLPSGNYFFMATCDGQTVGTQIVKK